jgi:hypothetical protein
MVCGAFFWGGGGGVLSMDITHNSILHSLYSFLLIYVGFTLYSPLLALVEQVDRRVTSLKVTRKALVKRSRTTSTHRRLLALSSWPIGSFDCKKIQQQETRRIHITIVLYTYSFTLITIAATFLTPDIHEKTLFCFHLVQVKLCLVFGLWSSTIGSRSSSTASRK